MMIYIDFPVDIHSNGMIIDIIMTAISSLVMQQRLAKVLTSMTNLAI